MKKSSFDIPGMDCAAEENLVRMKLGDVASVRRLEFDLAERSVTVYHDGEPDAIERALDGLALGSRLEASAEIDEVPASDTSDEAPRQRRLLWTVLLINAAFFGIEMTTGLISGSMGLVADSLDMLADAIVYGLSLIAVGSAAVRKKEVAKWAGYFQLTLAGLGFCEVLRRFLGLEAIPDFSTMIVVSILALAANGVSLYLLHRAQSKDAHMQASMIFTSNDIIINLGVIAAAVLVGLLGSSLPDLIVGAIVFLVVSRGAFRILALSR